MRPFLHTCIWSPLLPLAYISSLLVSPYFLIEMLGSHHSRVVELVLSSFTALELELRAIIETFRRAKRRGTIPSADTDPPARPPTSGPSDPSCLLSDFCKIYCHLRCYLVFYPFWRLLPFFKRGRQGSLFVPLLPRASPIVSDEVLGDVVGWLRRVVLWSVSIPAHFIGHSLRGLHVMPNETYNVLLNLLLLPVASFVVFCRWFRKGCCCPRELSFINECPIGVWCELVENRGYPANCVRLRTQSSLITTLYVSTSVTL